jgi:hypothetical protein
MNARYASFCFSTVQILMNEIANAQTHLVAKTKMHPRDNAMITGM